MTAVEVADTQAKLVELATLSLELLDLDGFIESTAASTDAADLRELAVAAASLQRVAHKQLSGGANDASAA